MPPFEVNLAPLRYSKKLLSDSGPLLSLKHYRRGDWIEAYATLKPDLPGVSQLEASTLYGSSHGTGTHAMLHQAEYIAITEALERWAFAQSISENPNAHGFQLDPSTNGMAAFPSWNAAPARRRARSEAFERWCLTYLWKNGLSGQKKESAHSIEFFFQPTWSRLKFVLLGKRSQEQWTYGFACSESLEKAKSHAEHERIRNVDALEKLTTSNPTLNQLPLCERRLVHFSSDLGYSELNKKLLSDRSPEPSQPTLLIDQPLPGPWNAYVQVWRCLYKNGTPEQHGEDVFFF